MTKNYHATVRPLVARPRSEARQGRWNNDTAPATSGTTSSGTSAVSGLTKVLLGSGDDSAELLRASLGIIAKDFVVDTEGSFAMVSQDMTALPQKVFEIVNIGSESNPVYAVHFLLGLYSDSFVCSGGVIPSTGPVDTTRLDALLDVHISDPSDGQILQYDAEEGRWINTDAPSSGTTASWGHVNGGTIELTVGGTTKTLITQHQSLSGYLRNSDAALLNDTPLSVIYSNVRYEALKLDGNHDFCIGIGTAAAGFNTFIEGYNLYLRTGQNHKLAVDISALQTTTFFGLVVASKGLELSSGQKLYLNDSHTIYLELTDSGLHLVGAGFYSDQYITAGSPGASPEE